MRPPIEDVKWDSDFFGYKVGKVEVASSYEFDIMPLLTEDKTYKLIYVFADNELDPSDIMCQLVDKKLTLHQRLNPKIVEFRSELPIETYDSEKGDYQELEQLALLSGMYSRFKVDKNFVNDEYKKLYTKWIHNSVYKNTAFEILVAKMADKIIGFVTLEKKTDTLSSIGLIAVAPFARDMGVGYALIQEAKKRSFARSFSEIQVVTQAENAAAFHLYQKADFTPIDMKYIYHYWNV